MQQLPEASVHDLNAGREIGRALFFTIATVALIEVCLITPVLTSGSVAGEKERQTYDLLVASLLTPWQIVWGKLVSALAFALLLIIAVVPVMSLAFLFGGVGLTEVLIAIVGLVTTAILYATIGLFWSALMRSSLGATSFAIGTVIVILLGIPFLIVIVTLILGPSAPSSLLDSLWFIYVSRLFIALHPFIALGTTASQLSSGESPFFEIVQTSATNVVVPSPWLLYAIFSLIATATPAGVECATHSSGATGICQGQAHPSAGSSGRVGGTGQQTVTDHPNGEHHPETDQAEQNSSAQRGFEGHPLSMERDGQCSFNRSAATGQQGKDADDQRQTIGGEYCCN
jgi:ABC-2 type transport system permease protein